jgi:hypothetical protein
LKIVGDIKDILSKSYDQMEIYDLFSELIDEEDEDNDMSFGQEGNETTVNIIYEGYEIEVKVTTHYNHNSGFITITKDEDLKEVIPFDYEVEVL